MQQQDTGLAARRDAFTPMPRPDWVKSVNEEGQCMDIKSLVPLDENSLIETAKANTGLDDFGVDEWRERFQVLCKAFDEESQLNLMGRLTTRSEMLTFLQSRLLIEDQYKRHPEIEDEVISRPVYIVGQGRSGTSFLQNLLSADPNNGTPRAWELMMPVPAPEKATYFTDPRIEKARALAGQINRIVPEMESLHEYSTDVPTESAHVQCLAFGSVGWISATYAQVPSFGAYMAGKSMVPVYEYEKRVMKYMQWKNPRHHWIMKSPLCLPDMPAIREVHPDVSFIWPHRDPVKALASMVNMVGTLHWSRSETPFIDGFDALTDAKASAQLLDLPIQWIESGVIPRDQILNIQYLDFVADPMGMVEKIYETFDIEMAPDGRAGMQTYLDDNPRSSRPAHKYPDDWGNLDAERAAYERYQSYFGVPNEIG